ncbi:chemotaxis response regulator protein-glutamate methylesterase [Herbaspirillum autotrophicum]|uniref:chemotaxis response regulator protein-glutamate methylesterase n=1 Tax=Herbaspirillum autotrophicum TaxID=180195 RepID=UPI00067DE1F5|nr:chemotaxis response regulator protein-glutamate methylesterase [Herbaspirillum autotrophicum]
MKIGIVNDTPMAVELLRRILATRPEHQVVWIAGDGEQAVNMCAWQQPDLILMDLVMPKVDGVEATRRIMGKTPCPILIVTVDVGASANKVYEAMGYGALDAVDTPVLVSGDMKRGAVSLMAKIDAIGQRISQGAYLPSPKVLPRAPVGVSVPPERTRRERSAGEVPERLIAIGASTGGPAALATVLRALPVNFSAAVIVVQHIGEAFANGMAHWLSQQTVLPVRLAEEGDQPRAGQVLVAGTSSHLKFKSGTTLGYVPEAAEDVHHPSIDVFFHSVVRYWRGQAVGVLLTGMGRDGADGLKAMRDKGYYTIAQDQESSAVYGMPKAAAELNAAVDVVPVTGIARKLLVCFSEIKE